MTCQVVGCREPALTWTLELELNGVQVEVALCRRHEREVGGGVRPPARERSA